MPAQTQPPVCRLTSPTQMPQASGFLWNAQLLVQVNCRGFVNAQFLQPEPAKYAHGPTLEAQTFMQPEAPYYAHHPGRFVYIKDEVSGQLFSLPYEPVRAPLDEFEFLVQPDRIGWRALNQAIEVRFELSLAADRPLELWSLQITNRDSVGRRLSAYLYFPVGYMSWMNQSASYSEVDRGIVCRSVTPYQQLADYYKQRSFKDLTVLLAQVQPAAWEARQNAFEGEGGLAAPSAIQLPRLSNSDALYETPTAAMQYPLQLAPGATRRLRFVFGPAQDDVEIALIRSRYLSDEQEPSDEQKGATQSTSECVDRHQGCLSVETPDPAFDAFVNHWLARQIRYHGQTQRMCTDPQARNYLQDAMGMCYIEPTVARQMLLRALAQQGTDGALPDGILVDPLAKLKYINQVPHTDHAVWLPLALKTYLDETGDLELLAEQMTRADGQQGNVFERVGNALRHLIDHRDRRGLSYIGQGDWCDPMNMVGHRGLGVSAWLSLATAYAAQVWSDVAGRVGDDQAASEFAQAAEQCNAAVNRELWDLHWYARGITDDGAKFGIAADAEGRIFLNPQAWAMLSGAADSDRRQSIIAAVEQHLETPWGVQLLSPAYTQMRDDIGRITQKHPGVAENGSIYNHAAAFYIYALYQSGNDQIDRAYRLLRQMIPGPAPEDLARRGQLPVFLPNYYRGAWPELPRTAGRSSQLVNTGTVHWYYHCLVDGLFGVRGSPKGLRIEPKLPSDWPSASVVRRFRGATFKIDIRRDSSCRATMVQVDQITLSEPLIQQFQAGREYQVDVMIPAFDA